MTYREYEAYLYQPLGPLTPDEWSRGRMYVREKILDERLLTWGLEDKAYERISDCLEVEGRDRQVN